MREGKRELDPSDLLKEKGLDAEDAKTVARELKVNTTLTKLNISYNSIGVEGAKEIRDALSVNESLTSIDLERNYIDTEGAREIGEMLIVNSSLQSLQLGKNALGAMGAIEIGKGLKGNKNLTNLDLSDNCIGTLGAKEIGESLKLNHFLLNLDISDRGVVSLTATAIKANSPVFVHLLPQQRLAFLQGFFLSTKQRNSEGGERKPLVRKLPLDVIRRILVRYKVAQGRREFNDNWQKMITIVPAVNK